MNKSSTLLVEQRATVLVLLSLPVVDALKCCCRGCAVVLGCVGVLRCPNSEYSSLSVYDTHGLYIIAVFTLSAILPKKIRLTSQGDIRSYFMLGADVQQLLR